MYSPAGFTSQLHRTARRPSRALGHRLGAWRPTPRAATGIIVAAATAYGFVAFFARSLSDGGMASSAVAFYRYALTAAVTVWFTALDPAKRTATLWAFVSGLAMGGGWIAYVRAIEVVDVATVGVVYMTYPFFTVALGALLFRVRPTMRAIGASVLVVFAAALVVSPGSQGVATGPVVAAAFLAPLTFGFAVTVLTERLDALGPLEKIGPVSFGAVVGTLPLVLSMPASSVLPADAGDALLIVGIGIGTSLVPMIAYGIAAPAVGGPRAATAGAVELPVMFAIGWLLFAEALMPAQFLAAGLIVVAIALSPARGLARFRPMPLVSSPASLMAPTIPRPTRSGENRGRDDEEVVGDADRPGTGRSSVRR